MSRDGRRALWLAENLFDEVRYSTFVVSASTSPVGSEYWRVANGRRSDADQWAPQTTNSTHWIQVDCGQPYIANCVYVDRENNLVDKVVVLETRNNSTQEWKSVWESTGLFRSVHPLHSTSGLGVRTEEGAYLREFAPIMGRYWRFRVPPVTGFAPRLSGLYLGLAYSPREPAVAPFDEDATEVSFDAAQTPSGWVGAGRVAVVRKGSASYRFQDFYEYDEARRFFKEFERRRPTVYIPQRNQAHRAMMVTVQSGSRTAPWTGSLVGREMVVQYREHEPKAE